MPSNKFAIFITNSPDKSKGSSLYLVIPQGTIRVSGANDKVRKATTFIRPYTIGYYDSSQLYDIPHIGLFPVEAPVNTILQLSKLDPATEGHHGNAITEILTTQNFFNSAFQPKTWIGSNKNGTEWLVAREEIVNAMLHVNETKTCVKEDKLIQERRSEVVKSNQGPSM